MNSVYFYPFIIYADTGDPVGVVIDTATRADPEPTRGVPEWQTDWTSEHLSAPTIEKYAVKSSDGELIALAAYQIRGRSAYVYILYAESVSHSSPTISTRESGNTTVSANF